MRLALAARSFTNIDAEAACHSRDTRHGTGAGGPDDRMSSSSAEGRLLLSFEKGHVAVNNGQDGLSVTDHIHIGLIKWSGVGCSKKKLSLLLIRLAHSWVDACEPGLHRGVVADKLDTDVPGTQIALGVGKEIIGIMLNDKAGASGWLGSSGHAQESGQDGLAEEHSVLRIRDERSWRFECDD